MRRIALPGKVYKQQVQQFIAETVSAISDNKDYPIRRLFEIFSFHPAQKSDAQYLIERGNLTLKNKKEYPTFYTGSVENLSELEIDIPFIDEQVNKIIVTFPEIFHADFKLEKTATPNPNCPILTFDFSSNQISAIFENPPAEWKIDRRQQLQKIIFNTEYISYLVKSPNSKEETEIILDLNLSPEQGRLLNLNGGRWIVKPMIEPVEVIAACLFISACCKALTDPDQPGPPKEPLPSDTDFVWFPDCVYSDPNWPGKITASFKYFPTFEVHRIGRTVKLIWNPYDGTRYPECVPGYPIYERKDYKIKITDEGSWTSMEGYITYYFAGYQN